LRTLRNILGKVGRKNLLKLKREWLKSTSLLEVWSWNEIVLKFNFIFFYIEI
jgi:hypothetical protein